MATQAFGTAVSWTASTLIQPIFTVPALIAALRWPDRVDAIVADVLRTARPGTTQKLQRPLAFLAAIGATLQLNRYLTRRSANNWTTDNTYDWETEIVLVTGGSSGIGLAVVRAFTSRGIKVVSIDVNDPPTDFPASAHFYKADITDWEQVTEVANLIKRDVGDPTILINNAGYSAPPLLLPTPVQNSHEEATDRLGRFEHLVSTNFTAHYRLYLHFVPAMAARNHGHFVTISSGMAFVGLSPSNEYCASKTACWALHDALAMELKHAHRAPRVRSTIYFPTWVRTPLVKDRLEAGVVAPALLLEAEDLAETVVKQCLSGESGGQIAMPWFCTPFSGLKGWPLWLQTWTKESMFKSAIPRRPDVSKWQDVLEKTT